MQKTINWKSVCLFLILLIIGCLFIYPMVWMVLSSVKEAKDVLSPSLSLLPNSIHLDNFSEALKAAPFAHYLWNSTWTSTIIVCGQLFLSSLLAYALTQFKFLGRNLLFAIILGTYMLPSAATYIPSYILLGYLGLTNSLWGLVLSNLSNVFTIFLLRQSFKSVPKEMIESARSEGVSEWKILWKIIVPMNKNTLINAGLISFVGNFNSYLWPSILINDEKNFVISVGLNSFSTSQGTFAEMLPILMAGTTLAVIPLVILYLALQKYFIGTTQNSTIKG